jgi:hypothetical protein
MKIDKTLGIEDIYNLNKIKGLKITAKFVKRQEECMTRD